MTARWEITDYKKSSDADLDIDVAGVAGQNMDTPKAKLFQNHWLVHRGIYYDPSYGKTTTGNTAFNANIVAWERDQGGQVSWRKAEGSAFVVRFGADVDQCP